ncbi:ABC transporter type 1/ ATPase component [Synechococcus sp. A15-127]|uniref:ABC transporter ATP-binding protein n=1 Tax=Synechococcus sp. A15-127 TaxID=1050624 RepID=UPI0018630D0F|nr:ABC transporter ATP-binding protein [Synechococcus sp. A15-127]QNI95449.1 ABC transporter type 1/ ATPase component [Synechococcus sp. A15-127]
MPDPSLRQLLRQLWGYLGRRRRWQLWMLLLVMLASSAAEVLSLAAVLPFLAVLANPEGLWNQSLVQQWGPKLGIASAEELLLPITLAFSVASLLAGTIRLLTLWLNGRLAAAIGSDLSCEAYRRTLYQPYAVHLARNSSQLIASISTDVIRVTNAVLNPLLLLLSSGLIAASLVATLLAIDWGIALGTGLVVALVYAAAMASSQVPLQRLARQQVFLNQRLIQTLQEGLGAIRDVLLNGYQGFYETHYRLADKPLRRATADAIFLSTYPRLVLEPAGMALIAVAGYVLVSQQGVSRALPLLGALALGAQRLLPMAQKVYEGWAQSRAAKDSLASVMQLLDQPLPADSSLLLHVPLTLTNGIRLKDVHFRYGPDLPEVLKGLHLEIRQGERIGLIGSTGSGKSTTLDLLMGLLQPTAGRILVNGDDLHDPSHPERLDAWRAAIAHVPQSIYLTDTSFAENIAFGLPLNQIDHAQVRRAAQQAQIATFIESSPQGYNSFVGERGIRLSGGQRQRIGIARALYKQAQILVFDEATSALDTSTEQAVMEAIEGLSRNLTIVMIAHRLCTVRRCDRIIRLDQGLVQSDGCPADMIDLAL